VCGINPSAEEGVRSAEGRKDNEVSVGRAAKILQALPLSRRRKGVAFAARLTNATRRLNTPVFIEFLFFRQYRSPRHQYGTARRAAAG